MGNNCGKVNKAHLPAKCLKKWNVSNSTKSNNVVPEWINQSHFEEILIKNEPDFEKIENFFVMPALSSGENYSSLMLRVTIDARLTSKFFTPCNIPISFCNIGFWKSR